MGLHRGYLGGTKQDKFYYLGRQDVVGILGGGYRHVFSVHPVASDWYHKLQTLNPHDPWQGPACNNPDEETQKVFKRLMEPARDYLNEKERGVKVKPKLNLKKAPRYIAYEDRPDVGIEVKAKPKINFKPTLPPVKPKIKFKGQ